MHIACIYGGYGLGEWKPEHRVPFDPQRLCDQPPGISGTELQVFGHARELARLGHEVTVFSRFTEDAVVDGVRYWQLDAPHSRCDLAIAYHDGRPLEGWKAKFTVAMHQTYLVSNRQQDATYTGADFAHRYLSASERCATHLRRSYGWPDVRVVPNAWDYGNVRPWRPVPGRIVLTTSVDRGAHRLVEALPLIRERVPEAHVVLLRRGSPTMLAALEGQQGNGVQLAGPLSRNETLALLATASCYAYPCDVPSPTEVFPVSLLEACATGVPCVLAPDDSLEDLFAPGVELAMGVKANPLLWRADFVERVVQVLKDELYARTLGARGQAWAQQYRFSATTQKLLEECAT